jgi:hypothetical protein
LQVTYVISIIESLAANPPISKQYAFSDSITYVPSTTNIVAASFAVAELYGITVPKQPSDYLITIPGLRYDQVKIVAVLLSNKLTATSTDCVTDVTSTVALQRCWIDSTTQ